MRSLKQQILILLLGSLVLLAASFLVVLGLYMKDRAVAAAIIKVKADLATCEEIIDKTYPGAWSEQEGNLYKGQTKISLNNDLVDYLSSLTGDTVTVFLGDTRVATTIRGSNGERAIGTKVSDNIIQTVLKDGQTYVGEANVVGQWHQTGYVPLRAENGKIIGIFYVGISHAYEQEIITRSLITMAELGLVLTVLIALLTWFFLKKVIISPLHNIMLETRDVATGHLTEKVKISGAKEIGELEDAFNQMVEQIQSLTEEINRVTSNNPLHGTEVKQTFTPGYMPMPSLNLVGNIGEAELPKGLHQATLGQIVQFLQVNRRPLSAEEVAEGVKLTRVTVRRYLEFLEHSGALKSEQKYGTVGRPVKLFIPL
ncbi:cache domain-containing protein [Desulfosporosinus nitroreducens]|uniref:Cache domain-containing protein n=1 Tax=Desulfosporosinus nitroreducens TaxID=2018668 RepID=A0ABT8QMD4_9FIRM|nr:cache domain-containing protein [Desulfosporosinus nitroreducens]MCO1600545.1 cache domain-containing protein [Desulfosporosinus nitroreducens]MDO0822501.1 cache domain-containing protein [Desulfosporosinus nitroreducens]